MEWTGAYRAGTNSQAYDNADYASMTLKEGISEVKAGLAKAKAFLNTVFTNPYVQKANIVLGAALNGTNAVTGIHSMGVGGEVMNNVVAAIGNAALGILPAGGALTDPKIAKNMNALLDELKNPNVGGIPIHADSETETHDSDIGQHLLISQSRQNKVYVADNVVPKPVTWQIKGYIMASRNALDGNLIIKPSLVLQRRMLQYYKDTRLPVVFKTHDNRFYTVLISHFDTSYNVQALNALQVNLTLVEFTAMTVQSEDIALGALSAVKEG